MEVSVTKEDIRLGRPGEACHCAVSRAVKRALGLGYRSRRIRTGLYIELMADPVEDVRGVTERTLHLQPVAPAVHKFMVDFDNNRVVEPFTFILENTFKDILKSK